MRLSDKKCVPCRGGVPPLGESERAKLLQELDGWSIDEGKLHKSFSFADFMGAMKVADRIAEVAEHEGHHPDLLVAWGKLEVYIWTHKINGLTESDFILAAKIDELLVRI